MFEDKSDLFYDIRCNVSGEKYVVVLKFERHCDEHNGYCSDPGEITSTTTTCYMYLTVNNLMVKTMDSKDKDYKIEFDDQDVGFSCGGSGYCGCTTMYNNIVGKIYNIEDPDNIKKYYGGGHFLEYYNSRVGERDARIAKEKYEKENAVRIRQEKYDMLLKKVSEKGGKVYSCYGNGGMCKDWIYLTVYMDRKLKGRRKYCEKCLAKYRKYVANFKKSM